MAQGQLYVGCPGLQLPSLMPEAIAAEAALRFTHVQFRTVSSLQGMLPTEAHARQVAQLSITGADDAFRSWSNTTNVPVFTSGPGVQVGFDAILDAANNFNSGTRHVRLDAGLTGAQLATSTAVAALIRSTIFPAFEFAMLAEDATFDLVRGAMHSALSAWDRVVNPVPARRNAALRRLTLSYGLKTAAGAVELARKGLTALEQLLRHHLGDRPAVHSDEWSTFFLGTASPANIDALVFAACTVAAASRFHATSPWSKLQIDAGLTLDVVSGEQEFPLLCQYGRFVSKRFYEQYSGLHFLNLPPVRATVDESASMLYSSGRATTLIVTGLFAATYMIVANARLILELLSDMVVIEEEEANQAAVADGNGEQAQ